MGKIEELSFPVTKLFSIWVDGVVRLTSGVQTWSHNQYSYTCQVSGGSVHHRVCAAGCLINNTWYYVFVGFLRPEQYHLLSTSSIDDVDRVDVL